MSDRVQAVERALLLLNTIAQSDTPPTASELAKVAGVNRATAWRLLNTLASFDLVERNPSDGRYSVGYGAVRLASASGASVLVRRARPILRRVAQQANGSAFLEVAAGDDVLVIDEARSPRAVQIDLAGMAIPLHCGSVGKLYLASLPESELAMRLEGPLEQLTSFTITDPSILLEQVERARIEGVAINYKEHTLEWCGISSAIRDNDGRDLAYLNVTLPTYDTTEADLLSLRPLLVDAAREIAVAIGVR